MNLSLRIQYDRELKLDTNTFQPISESWRQNLLLAANVFPLFFLTIEFLMNKIKIPFRQIGFVLLYSCLYFFVTYQMEIGTGFASFSSNLNYKCDGNMSLLAKKAMTLKLSMVRTKPFMSTTSLQMPRCGALRIYIQLATSGKQRQMTERLQTLYVSHIRRTIYVHALMKLTRPCAAILNLSHNHGSFQMEKNLLLTVSITHGLTATVSSLFSYGVTSSCSLLSGHLAFLKQET